MKTVSIVCVVFIAVMLFQSIKTCSFERGKIVKGKIYVYKKKEDHNLYILNQQLETYNSLKKIIKIPRIVNISPFQDITNMIKELMVYHERYSCYHYYKSQRSSICLHMAKEDWNCKIPSHQMFFKGCGGRPCRIPYQAVKKLFILEIKKNTVMPLILDYFNYGLIDYFHCGRINTIVLIHYFNKFLSGLASCEAFSWYTYKASHEGENFLNFCNAQGIDFVYILKNILHWNSVRFEQ